MGQREMRSQGHPKATDSNTPGEGGTPCPLREHHLEKVPSCPTPRPLLATAAASRLHGGAVDLEVGSLTPGGSPWPHPLFYFCSHGHERLLHVGGVLGTRLQEGDAQRVCELLARGGERRGEAGVRGGRPRAPGGPARPLTLAVVLSTTFLVVRSLLLPTRSLLTFSLA